MNEKENTDDNDKEMGITDHLLLAVFCVKRMMNVKDQMNEKRKCPSKLLQF
jgi:hypothetical protein